jgi:hypothetical protein
MLAGALAAARMHAQAPPQAAKLTPDQELERARQQIRGSMAQVGRVPLPISVEPAFQFKA